MRIYNYLMLFVFAGTLFTSCSSNDDSPTTPDPQPGPEQNLELEIKDFVWKGMNEIYVYKSQVPELGDDFFATQSDLEAYLEEWDSPEDLFYDGLTITQDRFSFITEDYVALENSFAGISETTGVEFRLYRFSGSDNLFGVVRYIIPGSNAESEDIERGDFFRRLNGMDLTIENYQEILASSSITFEIAKLEDNTVTPTGESVTINTQTITENPILVSKVIDVNGSNVGYLMYNSFVADFDDELNAAFAEFKSQNITDLILDLRYNGGGRVSSATRLASMITGQFTGEIFAKQQWNEDYQNFFLENDPDRLFNRFTETLEGGEAINSLNLTKLYTIVSSSTASASELVANGLAPYIEVVNVGGMTVGKSQASVTLYDSSNFGKSGANPDHKYAIQPLVYESVNANDQGVPFDGITPDEEIIEDVANMGVLGEESDPLLKRALDVIAGNRRSFSDQSKAYWYNEFSESGVNSPAYRRMYIDKLPELEGKTKRLDLDKK
ncbi:S41 family peptidase [Gramella sp. MAR_2010_147]|uniref:S41 family peptidase n=1 Tax=Gramella sp. MAR_2010_147 TaxID=1250205 RepID=UPI00087B39D6|nr:S41 family peptidase [Gramella sp. MAR_2010_147]SDR85597.1 C-terminal processing protease CtpA/Prc, contains a PDZ domain [Gramella sp. MAR_2010_147]